ncbi:MAG: hypothetical protein R2682_04045 [Pyrinomonadaceae bacterium]
MAIGSLGGWASAALGYQIAFIINAASFLISAYTVWLIPEDAVKEAEEGEVREKRSFISDLKEGLVYSVRNHFALTILIMNMIWATGGGAINVVYERLGGVYFAETEGWNPDAAVAILWTASVNGITLE